MAIYTQCRRDPSRLKQLSTVAILSFQFGLHDVVVLSSFLRSYQPCLIVIYKVKSAYEPKWPIRPELIPVSIVIKEVFPSMITSGQSKYITSVFFGTNSKRQGRCQHKRHKRNDKNLLLRAGVRIL